MLCDDRVCVAGLIDGNDASAPLRRGRSPGSGGHHCGAAVPLPAVTAVGRRARSPIRAQRWARACAPRGHGPPAERLHGVLLGDDDRSPHRLAQPTRRRPAARDGWTACQPCVADRVPTVRRPVAPLPEWAKQAPASPVRGRVLVGELDRQRHPDPRLQPSGSSPWRRWRRELRRGCLRRRGIVGWSGVGWASAHRRGAPSGAGGRSGRRSANVRAGWVLRGRRVGLEGEDLLR
jgi:hypothetical protein